MAKPMRQVVSWNRREEAKRGQRQAQRRHRGGERSPRGDTEETQREHRGGTGFG